MAVELATAYVSLVPSTKGIGKMIQSEFDGVARAASSSGSNIGSRLISGMTKTLKVGAATAGAAVTAVLGTALVKGFGRLQALEEADKRLESMGLSAGDTEKLMKSLNDTLSGTPYALSDGATAMARLVSSGADLGKVPGIMQSITDAAAFGQADLNEIAGIFSRIATNQKLSGGELEMLADRGIPALNLLADAAGVSAEEFRKLVSANQVDADQFFTLWEKGAKGFGDQNITMAGAAKGAGGVVRGAWGNTLNALARIGASILGPVYEKLPTLFGVITTKINEFGAALGPTFETGGEIVGRFMDRVIWAIATFDVAGFVDKVGSAFDVVKGWVSEMTSLVADFAPQLGAIAGGEWDQLSGTLASLGQAAVDVAPAIQTIITELARGGAVVGVSTWRLFLTTLELVAVVADTVLVPALQMLAGFLEQNQWAAVALVGAFAGFKAISLGSTVITQVQGLGKALVSAGGTAKKFGGAIASGFGAVRDIGSKVATEIGWLKDDLVSGFARAGDAARNAGTRITTGAQALGAWTKSAAVTGVHKIRGALTAAGAAATRAGTAIRTGVVSLGMWTKAAAASAAATARDTAAKALNAARTAAQTVATKAAAVAQGAFNAVMAMNPIMLVVVAIAALVAGLVLAYKNVDWFRNAVDAVGRFFRDTLWPILKQVGEFIGNVFVGAVQALTSAWSNVLWPAVQTVGRFFSDTLWPILQKVGEFIGNVFVTHIQTLTSAWSDVLWPALQTVAAFITDTVIPAIGSIGDKIGEVAGWVGTRVGEIVGFVTGIPGKITGVVSTMWDGITSGITAAKDWVSDRIDDIVSFVTGIGDAISSVGDVFVAPFKVAFNAIVRIWNATVGKLAFTVPDIPGVPGRGETYSMPRLEEWHTGGTLDGRLSGDEVVAKLLRSETVLTDGQIARLGAGIAGGTANSRLVAAIERLERVAGTQITVDATGSDGRDIGLAVADTLWLRGA